MTKDQEMQEAEIHIMDIAAREAIAQGWCEPETSKMTMDPILAEAIAKPVGRALRHWHDTAEQYARNAEYYRGLVNEIGLMLGDEVFISDDGSRQEDVLCAKVPQLVRDKIGELTAVDLVLARRTALDDKPDRISKIQYAITCAQKAERAAR